MSRLKVFHQGVEIQTFDLGENERTSLKIGRAENCDIRINDHAVGREHAVVSLKDHALFIRKKSKFGSMLVNGKSIDEAAIQVGDVISIADYQVEFVENTQVNNARASQENALDSVASFDLAPSQEPAGDAAVEIAMPEFGGDVHFEEGISEKQTGDVASEPMVKLEATRDVFAQENSLESAPQVEVVSETQPQPEIDFNLNSSPLSQEEDKTAPISTAQLKARLLFRSGQANVEEYVIDKSEISIGRGTDCDVVLTDKTSSRKHVLIKKAGASFVLQDLGSGNGTYVNGSRVQAKELETNDVIKIGDTEFSFDAVQSDYHEKAQEFMTVPDEAPAADAYVPEAPMQGAAASYSQPLNLSQPQGESAKKKETLLEKFRRQPKPRQILIGLAIAAVLYMVLDDGPAKKTKPKTGQAQVSETADFSKLPPEKKQFVINGYQLAIDLFKNGEYEKTIYEVRKIHEILPNGYKDSKDLELIANRTMETERAKQEERKRQEEQEKIRKEVAELVEKAEKFVKEDNEPAAREVFALIFERDPENASALRLKGELDEKIERKRLAELEKMENAEKRARLLELLKKGDQLLRQEKYYAVIDAMIEAPVTGCTDEKLLNKARWYITEAKARLKSKTQPFIDQGYSALDAGDFPVARDAFYAALKIDPKNTKAKDGLAKVRDELRNRSRAIYTDAVVMESVSDFEGAKARFQECLEQAMPDDIYYARCKRKLARFNLGHTERGTASAPVHGPSGEPSNIDPEMPKLEPQPEESKQ